MPFLIILGLLVLVALYLIGFYNTLRTLQVRIKASIQEIGNQLKRQSDLIPNLIESAKGYLKHEKEIFKLLTDARQTIDKAISTQDPKAIDKAEIALSKALQGVQVIVESNPQIQAAGVVSNLMNELRDTSDKVMYSRRTLIDLAADFNVRISTFPGVVIAPIFGFIPQTGLETPVSGDFVKVSDSDTVTPSVKL